MLDLKNERDKITIVPYQENYRRIIVIYVQQTIVINVTK